MGGSSSTSRSRSTDSSLARDPGVGRHLRRVAPVEPIDVDGSHAADPLAPILQNSVGMRRSWDQIATRNGFIVSIDQAHLNDRAATTATDLIADWLVQPVSATPGAS